MHPEQAYLVVKERHHDYVRAAEKHRLLRLTRESVRGQSTRHSPVLAGYVARFGSFLVVVGTALQKRTAAGQNGVGRRGAINQRYTQAWHDALKERRT